MNLVEKGLQIANEDPEKNSSRSRLSLRRKDGSFRWMKFFILLSESNDRGRSNTARIYANLFVVTPSALFLVVAIVIAMAVLGKFGKLGGKKKGRKSASRPLGHALDADTENNNGTISTSSMQPMTSFGFGSGAFSMGSS